MNLYSPAKKRRPWAWIGLGIAAIAVIVVYGLLAQACGDKPIPGASARLQKFEADPVATFRAPGTKLLDDSKQSGVDRFPMEQTETRLDQVFSMNRDPAVTVEAYSQVAEAAGWRQVFEGCSRSEQATGRSFSRDVDGQSSFFSIRAELGTSPKSTRNKPTLTVSIVAGNSTDPVAVGTRRNDLHCLDGLDPSRPELAVPKIDRVTPEALCAAVSLDGIQGVKERQPFSPKGDTYPSQCNFHGGIDVGTLFEVSEATEPLAYYQDHSPADAAPGQAFPFRDYEDGVWLMSDDGPLVVRSRWLTTGEYGYGPLAITPERLLQIADDLAAL